MYNPITTHTYTIFAFTKTPTSPHSYTLAEQAFIQNQHHSLTILLLNHSSTYPLSDQEIVLSMGARPRSLKCLNLN